jgi:hypothetical protein
MTNEEAKTKLEKLEEIYTARFEECMAQKEKLNEGGISEELKYSLKISLHTRLNEISRVLFAIKYDLF